MVEVYSVRMRIGYVELFTCSVNRIHSAAFRSYFYTLCLWSSKLVQSFCLHATNNILEFGWLATWLRCVLCAWGWGTCSFHMFGKPCTFGRFLAPISTLCVFEAPNLYSTFVFMILMIFQSLADWQHGWGVFCACENGVRGAFHMFCKPYTFSCFLAPISTPCVFEAPNLYSTFIFMLPMTI